MSIFRSNNPVDFDAVDGIVIDESAPAPTIQGVGTGTAILVGQFQRGPSTLRALSSVGDLQATYGKDSSYSGYQALRNKKFSSLKLIRVVASDATLASKAFQYNSVSRITFSAKQGKGAYGNNLQVKIEEGSSSLKPIWDLACVADVSGSLDALTFILKDKAGTVGFWIDVDAGGGSAPAAAAACTRNVKINTITTGMTAAQVAGVVATAVNADSKFTASLVNTSHVSILADEYCSSTGSSASTSTFTLTNTVVGVTGKKYTVRDNNANSVFPDEVYDNVQIGSISTSTFSASKLVTAAVNSSAFEPDNIDFTSFVSGSDGTVADSDYQTSIDLAGVEGAGNVLFLDVYNATRRTALKQHSIDTQDKMVILAGDETDDKDAVITDVASYRDTDGRIIYAFNWIETSLDGADVFQSPASWYASIISQTGPNIDPADAANVQFLLNAKSLKFALTRTDYIALKNAGVSAFEMDSDLGGIKVKSGIVTQISDSSKVQVLRRRMTDYLTNSAAKFLKLYQNGPNSRKKRDAINAAIQNFVKQNQAAGVEILPTDNDVPAGSGKVTLIDTESLNTADSIGAGFMYIIWKQRIFSSMRYIVLQAEIGTTVIVTAA